MFYTAIFVGFGDAASLRFLHDTAIGDLAVSNESNKHAQKLAPPDWVSFRKAQGKQRNGGALVQKIDQSCDPFISLAAEITQVSWT